MLFPQDKVLLFDGSKGVLLQEEGLLGHEAAEEWNRSHPQAVRDVYRAYIAAGSQAIQTNTFPGNAITLQKHGLGDAVYALNFAGVRLAQEEAAGSVLVGASVGPTGEFLEPAGPLSFQAAVEAFLPQMQAFCDAGADFVSFETFTDLQELRAAIFALKQTGDLPFITTLSFEGGGRTLSGNPAEACAITCQSLGASLVGANCSGGPASLCVPIARMGAVATVPLCVKPNAGMPSMVNGHQVYHSSPQEFNGVLHAYIKSGVRLVGGCCGATPQHICAMAQQLAQEPVPPPTYCTQSYVASATAFGCYENPATLMVEAYATEGTWDDLADDALDAPGDCLLLQFGAATTAPGLWEMLSALCLMERRPLGIQTKSPTILRDFLRYYPGRAAVVLPTAAPELAKIAAEHGALCLLG